MKKFRCPGCKEELTWINADAVVNYTCEIIVGDNYFDIADPKKEDIEIDFHSHTWNCPECGADLTDEF